MAVYAKVDDKALVIARYRNGLYLLGPLSYDVS